LFFSRTVEACTSARSTPPTTFEMRAIDRPDLVLHPAAGGAAEGQGYRHYDEDGRPDRPDATLSHPTPFCVVVRRAIYQTETAAAHGNIRG
jgi:hypothetical protein